VPFAYEPLGESAWPAGDGRKLGLALAATLVLLGAAVLQSVGAADRVSFAAVLSSRRWRRREDAEPPRLETVDLPKP